MSWKSCFVASVAVLTTFTTALVAEPGSLRAADSLEGKVVADQVGRISVQLTGERSVRVEEMTVRIGDRVRKGDLLARLSSEQLKADRLVAQRTLEEAEATVGEEEADVDIARLRRDRQAGLRQSPSFNRAALEDAEVELKAAESQLASAQSIAKRREAELARIDLEISFAEITAPYDGVIVDVMATVGAAVTQRQPDLMTILDLTKVEIEVTGASVEELQPGQAVEVTVAGGDKQPAKVRAVWPQLGSNGTTQIVRIAPEPGSLPATVHDGQSAQVFVGG